MSVALPAQAAKMERVSTDVDTSSKIRSRHQGVVVISGTSALKSTSTRPLYREKGATSERSMSSDVKRYMWYSPQSHLATRWRSALSSTSATGGQMPSVKCGETLLGLHTNRHSPS